MTEPLRGAMTVPPFHPNCRSVTAPYFNDEFELGTRAARDPETGKTVSVPEDMTYPEWKKVFVDKTETVDEWKAAKNGIAKSAERGIINISNAKEEIEVHIIGKLDRNIYKCITEDIVTDDVIITEERITHIKNNHPNDYEIYYRYLKNIIEQPEYILESKKPNTALILKEFKDNEKQFKTVLRLLTSTDNPEYKNSVITFMKINKTEYNRLLRNKKILYKNV